MSRISAIKIFAVSAPNSLWTDDETMAIPFILAHICSAVSFRKREPDFEGIMVVVIGAGPAAIEITIDPILSAPSETETKWPLSNRNICREKFRSPEVMVFL